MGAGQYEQAQQQHTEQVETLRRQVEALGRQVAQLNGQVASSTASHRQRIQRLGRILRTAKGKEVASVYTIFVTGEERKRLENEEENLEGITSVSWYQGHTGTDA